MQGNRDYRPDINGLRAIAVLTVMAFHFVVPGFRGGFLGVDVFFVISGFLMTKIIVSGLENGRFSVLDFWLARARRIVPALAALCVVLLFFGWFAVDPIRYRNLGLHVVSALGFFSNWTLFREAGYFDLASAEKWLLHTWSLSLEWQFYAIYPLILTGLWRWAGSRRAVLAALGLLFFGSLVLSIVGTAWKPDAAYFLLPTRVWELAAGGLAFVLMPYVPPSAAVRRGLELAGLAAIALGTMLFSAETPWPGYPALVPVLGTTAVILAQRTQSRVTVNPAAQFLGDASYSIYLWHWPIYVALNLEGLGGSWFAIIAGICLSLVLGRLSYRIVETPWRKPWARKRKEWIAQGAVAAVLMGVAGAVYAAHGSPSRLSAGNQSYRTAAAALDDWDFPGRNCKTRSGNVYCYRPGKGRGLAMFIGDSHAAQWYPRYGASQTGEHSTLFVTRNACLPVRGVDSLIAGRHCAQYAEAAWREVFERKPRTLIVASIWLTYFFDVSGGAKHHLCVATSSGCQQPPDLVRRVFDRLTADIGRARELGVRVVLVGPTPYSSVDYPHERLGEIGSALPWALGVHPTVRAQYSIDHRTYGRAQIERMLKEVASASGAALVMPQQFMCKAESCSYVDQQGAPIYKDQTHLRSSYVRSGAFFWLDQALDLDRVEGREPAPAG